MIRLFSILLAALISASAYATPKLGDFASFDTFVVHDGQQMNGIFQQEIVQFDSAKNEFLERQTVTMEGQPTEVTDLWKDASEYLDDATIDAILENCDAVGGTRQAVATRAGEFDTCAMGFDQEESSGTAYVAKVPFGVARVDTVLNSGVTIILSINSFR